MYKDACLYDTLDIKPHKGTGKLRYVLPSLSSSGEKIVFAVQTNRDNPQHGGFSIASTDGTHQKVLSPPGGSIPPSFARNG